MNFDMNFIVHIVANCLVLHHTALKIVQTIEQQEHSVNKQQDLKNNRTTIKNKKGRRLDVCEIIRKLKMQLQTMGRITYNLKNFVLYIQVIFLTLILGCIRVYKNPTMICTDTFGI